MRPGVRPTHSYVNERRDCCKIPGGECVQVYCDGYWCHQRWYHTSELGGRGHKFSILRTKPLICHSTQHALHYKTMNMILGFRWEIKPALPSLLRLLLPMLDTRNRSPPPLSPAPFGFCPSTFRPSDGEQQPPSRAVPSWLSSSPGMRWGIPWGNIRIQVGLWCFFLGRALILELLRHVPLSLGKGFEKVFGHENKACWGG